MGKEEKKDKKDKKDKKEDKKDKKDKKEDKKDKKEKKEDKGKDKKQDKKDKKEKKKLSKKDKKDKKQKKKTAVAHYNLAPSQAIADKCNLAASSSSSSTSSASKHGQPIKTVAGAEWNDAGKAPGLQIWRVENFKIVPWPAEYYGSFFDGDSYIVLHTYSRGGSALGWDVHFWLGESTSQDEAGTAAYKTVELDDALGGAPVQHREVQGFESDLFLSYFSGSSASSSSSTAGVGAITILHGGVESGFHHVEPESYRPRLLHIKGKRNVRVEEVEEREAASLNSGDAFILDAGLKLWVWQGKASSVQERAKAGEIARAIRDQRGGKPQLNIISEGDNNAEFWSYIEGDASQVLSAEEGGDDFEHERTASNVKKLFKLSDANGTLTFTQVASGKISRSLLDSNDAFIFDTGAEVFAWVGKGASPTERTQALQHAQMYLDQNGRPPYLPISRIFEGGENEVFNASFDA
ncbi:Severin [Balamuthia mandrillaris]